jgi:hypothetical protein
VTGWEKHRGEASEGLGVGDGVVSDVEDELHVVAKRNAAPPLGCQFDPFLERERRPLPGRALQKRHVVAGINAELRLRSGDIQTSLIS